MTASSRHMACRTCRDRKVRCDGGQPSCETCKRHGETCVYVQSTRQSKNDLLAKIDDLQDRLARAEERLNCSSSSLICPSASHGYGIPFHLPTASLFSIEASPPPFSHLSGSQPALLSLEAPLRDESSGDMATKIPGPEDLAGVLSPFASLLGGPSTTTTTATTATTTATTTTTTTTEEEMHLQSLPSSLSSPPPLLDEQDLSAPTGRGSINNDPALPEVRPPSPRLPTLRTIRALNGDHQWQQQLQDPPQRNDECTVLRELIRFVSATSANEAYIAGITTAVAEYLVWARRMTLDINQTFQILDILVARLQETANLANTARWVEFRNLQTALGETGAWKLKLGVLEHELQAAEADISTFFSTQYDIHLELDSQRRYS
ncbi:hypothetical protein ARAM_001881 [Aspergillus rambellii]|uniref:Zn(2)-C6 fungal-type domain-containing protein n=1 Tax=Aspergillus rambellii TaxID=308745 RepID=A0A0F8TZT3_9EURO|nr:hypothetical protein ARAM_001881 [Aspergillus rambellii]